MKKLISSILFMVYPFVVWGLLSVFPAFASNVSMAIGTLAAPAVAIIESGGTSVISFRPRGTERWQMDNTDFIGVGAAYLIRKDATDSSLYLAGGDSLSQTQGGVVQLHGSTKASEPNRLILRAGSGAGSEIQMHVGGSEVIELQTNGVMNFKQGASMGSSTIDPSATAETDWLEIRIGGTQRFIPVYAAS